MTHQEARDEARHAAETRWPPDRDAAAGPAGAATREACRKAYALGYATALRKPAGTGDTVLT